MPTLGERVKRSWNAFMGRDPTVYRYDSGFGSNYRPDRMRFKSNNSRSIVTSIYNRIAVDCAQIDIRHIRLDPKYERYKETIKSPLNECLSLNANLDQTGRALIQDAVMSMFDEGCIALVPTDTSDNPELTDSYDIYKIRVGKIKEWYPSSVKVEVYNENTGQKQDVIMLKRNVAIVENPFYAIMNEPNSTLQRLIRVLNQIDRTNEQNSAGKLDLIIQLPYVIKSEAKREQANARRKEIEAQLTGSQYGIAYTDGTERITQLNRSVENNLWSQAKDLTSQLYNQLGLTEAIFNGTASAEVLLDYYNRTIEPILAALINEMERKWLSKTARTQLQAIRFFRDPFRLVPVSQIAEIADKFTRNEIMTSNEIRAVIGMTPSEDPKADQLVNSNLNHQENTPEQSDFLEEDPDEDHLGETDMTLDEISESLDELDQFDDELDLLEEDLDNVIKHSIQNGIDFIDTSQSLAHYASPYYDPKKAHEYYMEHRKLKGRTSTSGLNDKGKMAAGYVKKQLNDERDRLIESHRSKTNNSIDGVKESTKNQIDRNREVTKASIEQHKNQMNSRIDFLKNKLKQMSSAEKSKNRDQIKAEISKLREDNSAVRKLLNEAMKAKNTSLRDARSGAVKGLREDHKTYKTKIREEYNNKYASELDKMRSDSSMLSKRSRR